MFTINIYVYVESTLDLYSFDIAIHEYATCYTHLYALGYSLYKYDTLLITNRWQAFIRY